MDEVMTMRNSTVCSGNVSPDLLKQKEMRGKLRAGFKEPYWPGL